MKRILACTSIRSDYDLMSPLYVLLDNDPDIELKLLISGAHLSPTHGNSVNQIKQDGFDVLLKVETLLSSDSSLSRVKSASFLLQGSLEVVADYSPDLIIFAGDREDVLVYAMIGGYLSIPTAHFFAGDHVKDGYIDNPIRHATSKLASTHFVTLPEHKYRLVRMGEDASRVHVIGNIALDRFVNFTPIPKSRLQQELNLPIVPEEYALVIFHPITSELDLVGQYFENMINCLLERGMQAFISYPNIDPGNHELVKIIEKFSAYDGLFFYKNMAREDFLSVYKHAKLIIGNSSSGICEAASLKIPAINVGIRQTGRFADDNVIFCEADVESIRNSLELALSTSFQDNLEKIENSYGVGDSAKKAYQIIKEVDFSAFVAKVEDPLEVRLQ